MRIKALLSILMTTILSSFGSSAYSQIDLLEQTILGEWQTADSGTFNYQYFVFKKDGELELRYVQTRRDGKPITPTHNKSTAVYIFGTSACKVGEKVGELYIAKDSERCCFETNTIGKTLILDQIKPDLGSWRGLCESKTLRRTGK